MISSIIVVQAKSNKSVIIYIFDLQTSKVSGTVIWNGNSVRDTRAAISHLIIICAVVVISASTVVVDSTIVLIATFIALIAISIVLITILTFVATS